MLSGKSFGVLVLAVAAVALAQEAYGTTAALDTSTVYGAGPCNQKSNSYTCPKAKAVQLKKCPTGSVIWASATSAEADKNVESGQSKELCKVGTDADKKLCASFIKTEGKQPCDPPATSGTSTSSTN
ncbi:MAG TPA: hypothetical protein VGE74_32585 [Gemmata sp.]